uniref:Uncharacterized protein n=1 Tax=viral metagenome TaxID=1070528 RepID=A0A6M3IF98_9ZZZZ
MAIAYVSPHLAQTRTGDPHPLMAPPGLSVVYISIQYPPSHILSPSYMVVGDFFLVGLEIPHKPGDGVMDGVFM